MAAGATTEAGPFLAKMETEAGTDDLQSTRPPRVAELFVLKRGSREELAEAVLDLHRQLTAMAEAGAEAHLSEIAFSIHRQQGSHRNSHRAACVARRAGELRDQLGSLLERLRNSAAGDGKRLVAGAYYGGSPPLPPGKLAFLFPGQGSQFPGMMADLAAEFREVRECFELADDTLRDAFDRPLSRFVSPPSVATEEERTRAFDALKATNVAQPALGASDLAMLRLLGAFGVRPSMVAGHSYGELVALHAAGSIDARALLRLSLARGAAMLTVREDAPDADLGQMVAVAADEATVREAVQACDSVWLANLNAPRQTVISGSGPGIATALDALKSAGLSASLLPVACGFHSPLMAPARDRFAAALDQVSIQPSELPVYSNVTAARAPADPEGIRSLLTEQLVQRVRFAEQIQTMYEAGARIFVEVGPNDVLSNLVRQILAERPHAAIATQSKRRHGLVGFLRALAALSAEGVDVHPGRMFEGHDPAHEARAPGQPPPPDRPGEHRRPAGGP
jgi:acyl transferase domain-containing protein